MNKCPKCGTEFDGKFCPNCGEKWEEEKLCPKCGAKLPGAARFCNECGYSFTETTVNTANPTKSFNHQKIYNILNFVSFAAFALFSVLLLAFFAAPVAVAVLGLDMPNMSLGNVYGMSGVFGEIPELKGTLIALIIFAVLSVIFSGFMGAACFLPKFKNKELKFFKKQFSLPTFLGYISFVFYFALFAIAIAIIATIASVDGGIGIISAGACPILILVFALLFALIAAGSYVGQFLIAKKQPELKEIEENKRASYWGEQEAKRKQFFATHTAPVEPVLGESKKAYKREVVVYKHEKRKYDKASDKKTPAAVIWLDLHKTLVISIVAVLAVAIIAVSIIVPILTNKFRISVVEKIQLGYTQEQVADILGEPDKCSKDNLLWQYCGGDYSALLEKIDKNDQEQEKAMESGNLSSLDRLVTQQEQLEKQLSVLKYDYIEIQYEGDEQNGYAVKSVLFEKDHCDSTAKVKKEVDNVELSANKTGYYSDLTGDQEEKKLIGYDDQFYYNAYYKNGAFYRAYIKNETSNIGDKTATIKWSDEFNTYEASIDIVKIGELVGDGVWYSTHGYSNSHGSTDSYLYYRDIKNIILPDNVKAIGDYAFYDCSSLESIIIPDSVTTIGSYAFEGCTSLERITIGDSVTSISNHAFRGCKKIIRTQDGVLYVDKWVIDCDTSVTNVNLRENTKGIADSAFEGFTSLESIEIPAGVTTIGNDAFYYCTSLASIDIPDSVTYIGENAFSGCYKLVEVINQSQLDITKGSTDYGYVAYHALSVVDSAQESKLKTTQEGYVFLEADGKTCLVNYIGNETVLQLPENYEDNDYDIYAYAFYDNDKITSVTIPDSVTYIGSYAFEGCTNLESVTIPDSVNQIGHWAFEGCTNIKTATIPAFAISYIPQNSLQTVVITRGNSIDYEAFRGCTSLESITIPDSVTSISRRAFHGCTSLVSVTFENQTRWKVSEDYYNFSNAQDVDVSNSTVNAQNLTDPYKYSNYYWHRYDL